MGQQILGRKQKISNDAWLEAMKQIEDLVPKSELDERGTDSKRYHGYNKWKESCSCMEWWQKIPWCSQMSADKQE